MDFAPAIDRRVVTTVGRAVDISCSAVVWRAVRRRAQRLRVATPSYESVRRLVLAERDRRARLAAALVTIADIATRRIPLLPDITHVHEQRLARYRASMQVPRPRLPP